MRLGLGLAKALAPRVATNRVIVPIPVVNRVNTTVTDLGGGVYRIAKTGGVDGQFDASAISNTGASGNFTLKIVLSTPNDGQLGVIGMNSDPLSDNDYTSIDYGVLLSSGTYFIYESNVYVADFVDNGAPVWISRSNGTLTYRQGADFATATISRTVPDATGTLSFDSSIQDVTAVLDVSLTAG